MSTAYADDLVVDSRCGRTFKASRRTWAHIDFTLARLEVEHPGAQLVIMQGCYNTGVELSKGTHDFDAVVDLRIIGLDWWAAQWFMRRCGWACWYRYTGSWAASSKWHLHAVSLGYTTRVGIYVPGQVDDYYHHALGLKGQHDSGDDDSRFPADIHATIFDFEEHAPMTPDDKAWIDDRLNKQRDSIVAGVVAAVVDGAKLTLAQAVRQGANAAGLVRRLGRELGHDLDKREQKP